MPKTGKSDKQVAPPPAKPPRWSERRYRDTYDSTPVVVVTPDGTRYRCCGPVSAYVIARRIPGAVVVEP